LPDSGKIWEFWEKRKKKFTHTNKIDFADKWVHLRKSNTEPIIRVYSEASTMQAAEDIGQKIMDVIHKLAQ
jgi:phosphomannomutase